MKAFPKISIITATYNRPYLLQRMIESIICQSYTDWELIIIDDSTNSKTEKLMRLYKSNAKINYSKNKRNQGLPFSRNHGLDTASGEWVTFLDDDDFYTTHKTLNSMITKLHTAALPWVVFNKVLPNGTTVTQILKKQKKYNWTKDFLFGQSFRGDGIPVFKKDFIGKIRYHGENRSEWQFWYSLSLKSDFLYHSINVVTAEYLPDGMSNLGYLKNERIYQGQQFKEMIKCTKTWKYLPTIAKRYVASFVVVRKLLNRLRNKQTDHQT